MRLLKLPKSVEIIEVGPRDGLQNEPQPITTEQKKELIARLAKAGYGRIETTAFVHPKWVPQMSDAEEIAKYCNELGINYIALTPNVRGLQRAIEAGAPQVAVFIGASTAFNEKNINKSTKDSLLECEAVFDMAKQHGKFIRAYISMSFTCPYQGDVSFDEVNFVCERFVKLGADEVDIGDTNGHANPKIVYDRFSRLRDLYPDTVFVGHFHDTWKMSLANTLAAMQAGVEKFDTSIGGLGGCPYSPGATGNVATEDVLRMLSEMGIDTGLQFDEVTRLAPFAKSLSTRV